MTTKPLTNPIFLAAHEKAMSTVRVTELIPAFDRPPETPEAVALVLTRAVLAVGNEVPSPALILDTYSECLTAVNGSRDRTRGKFH